MSFILNSCSQIWNLTTAWAFYCTNTVFTHLPFCSLFFCLLFMALALFCPTQFFHLLFKNFFGCNCGMWNWFHDQRLNPCPWQWEAQNLIHRTTREVPAFLLFETAISFIFFSWNFWNTPPPSETHCYMGVLLLFYY